MKGVYNGQVGAGNNYGPNFQKGVLRGDFKPYPHNVKLVNFYEHFSQKLLDLDM